MSDLLATGIPIKSLKQDRLVAVEAAGRSFLATLHEGRPVVFPAQCPHAAGDLAQGTLRRGRIDCPVHGWCFDLVSGRALYPPDESCRLRLLETAVVDGLLFVRLP